MNAARVDLLQRLAADHARRVAAALQRRLRPVQPEAGMAVVVDGRRRVNFASNDYLGLARDPALREALAQAARADGVGAGAAHLLGGHRDEHARLEAELAQWLGRERALLFSTGYMANVGVLSALLTRGDLCVQDKLNHASLIDGARLAGSELKRYVHGDAASATRQLASRPDAAALLATDGVFSMDGDVAPLRALAQTCAAAGACLLVDDAHGLGVLGPAGAGSVAAAGLGQREVPILMGTLGKALGTFGAFVAGSAALIDGLIHHARSFVYTTAMPPAVAAATRAALARVRADEDLRRRLHARIAQFCAGAAARGIALLPSATPIQPVPIGSSATAVAIATQLEQGGWYVPAIRPPTVPQGQARLRVTLSALHAEAQVEGLLDALQAALRAHAVAAAC